MDDDTRTDEKRTGGTGRAAFNAGGAVIAFGFVWIVFDNLALAIVAALIVGGGLLAAKSGRRKD
jgi:hypothetical protein